jgi:hypothetical protein
MSVKFAERVLEQGRGRRETAIDRVRKAMAKSSR